MIITFPFEDDPYYSAPPPASYATSAAAALTTPGLVKKYSDLARGANGGNFPVGKNRFWHGGVHLQGTRPIRAVADGTVVAYRLDSDYTDSALDVQTQEESQGNAKQIRPRQFSASFLLIRHECEKNDGGNALNRYTGAHFYSLYANLMPKRALNDKPALPPFLTTGEDVLFVSGLRGDKVTVLEVNSDLHRMTKVRVTDINTNAAVEGWLDHIYLDLDPARPPRVSDLVRLSYPICALYACHPSERRWRPLDAVRTISHPVRVGEIIGYAGKTDGPSGVLEDSFHFEIFTAENTLVRQMMPLEPGRIADPYAAHQEYADARDGRSDGMGKVWLTRNANLVKDKFPATVVAPTDLVLFPAGSCFVTAVPCSAEGRSGIVPSELNAYKLFDLNRDIYYAYASEDHATADGRELLKDAWVTLTTDADWSSRGWHTYKDKELKATEDAFVEDDDAVMQAILNAAHSSTSTFSLTDLQTEGMEVLLRRTAVHFHTEWDSDDNARRYDRLRTGEDHPLPGLTEKQFGAYLRDMEQQQFWSKAAVASDGVSGSKLELLTVPMNAKNWHFHPIGFLADIRECLTTNAALSEESFEIEIRANWYIALKLIEKRLEQLNPWKDADALLPPPPPPNKHISQTSPNHQEAGKQSDRVLWEKFIYWFGVDPNTITMPETLHGQLPAAPAGHHVCSYLQGMRQFFRHLSMHRVTKGSHGLEAGAWVFPAHYPCRPLVPAEANFEMEFINIGPQYGLRFAPFRQTMLFIDQNRLQVQLHEVAHLETPLMQKTRRSRFPPEWTIPIGSTVPPLIIT
ncbi:hypothetical protein [Caballeronia sp. LZ016]|uniref:hypothetical protein n=1 Tax=Caballeronia sp. LZ016 TaxID=3038554 RepID=UPI00286732AE|nr:hypothetical protein [Caballeronia sp. LZ016]MDR5738919.1 hypothetical protein [Caballeronia sp. LZ016]